MWLFFFFKQKTAYEMRISDWSSDVCSSDLMPRARAMTSSAVGLSGVLVWASVSAIGSFLLGSFGYSLLTRYVGAAAAEPAGEENRVIPPCTADAAGVHPGAEGEYQIGSASGRERVGPYG